MRDLLKKKYSVFNPPSAGGNLSAPVIPLSYSASLFLFMVGRSWFSSMPSGSYWGQRYLYYRLVVFAVKCINDLVSGFLSESHLADTLVVKLAQLLEYMSLVVPVMSSHWAGAVPPAGRVHRFFRNSANFVPFISQPAPSAITVLRLSLSLHPFQAGWQSVSAWSKALAG